MKSKLYLFFIIAFLFQSAIVAQKKLPGINGSWDSDLRSSSGIGTIWNFKDNGKIEITSAAMIDYLYATYNDTLITVYIDKQTGKAHPDTSLIKIKNNTLTQTLNLNGKKQTRVLKREGEVSDKTNIEHGYWKGKNSAKQDMTYKFTKDHRLIFRVPFETRTGTYKHEGSSLLIKLKGQKQQKWNVRFINQTMVLENDLTGSEIAFERSK
jgi:hypothetical protein